MRDTPAEGAASVEPFIDAHQHFWNLAINPYPWLQGETVPNFRYGDYSALRRSYLPEDLAREVLRLGRRLRDLDAARLPASAGVHLRLHDDDVAAERARRLFGLGGRGGEASVGDGDAEGTQQLLGLVLVDVHRSDPQRAI